MSEQPVTPPGDFRVGARDIRPAAGARGVPERRPGAEPADAESPEYSRGEPLDNPQPSARRRPELEGPQAGQDKADVRLPEESF